MPQCPSCGRENRESARFCRHCSEPMGVVCASCGGRNLPDASYCDVCGTVLREGADGRAASGAEAAVTAPPAEPSPEDASPEEGYTPRHLQQLIKEEGGVEGERKPVVVLFVDVSGFTSLSETFDPEDVHQIMSQCFEILTGEVHRFGGTVNQYTGDGIMALFGAPKARENSPRDALSAALAIQERMRHLALRLEEERKVRFHLRIGLNAGEVVVGRIGDNLRTDYTATGDTTNFANRLQSAAEPGTALVSESLYRLVREWFVFEDLGLRDFKGKSEPQRVYRLVGPGKVSTDIEVAALRGLLKLRERDGAMETLSRIYREVGRGRGQIVTLVGEAGVGKSRLVHEFSEALLRDSAEPPLFLFTRAYHYNKNAPFALLRNILETYAEAVGLYCGIVGSDKEASLWQETVRARAEQILADDENSVEDLSELLGLGSGPQASATAAHPKKGIDALQKLFFRESQQRPIVLAVDNMRHADAPTIDFVESLVAGSAVSRLLLLTVFRPGFDHSWASRRNFHQITLTPLSREASDEMIREILGEAEVAPELAELIDAHAQGNPFFIEEMVRGMRESEVIALDGDQFQIRAAPETIDLPRTIQDVVLARLDALPHPLREVLQAASVIGTRFDYDLLTRVMPDVADLEDRFSALQEMDLVYSTSGTLHGEHTFASQIIQELAYREMLRGRREALHERVGRGIEAGGPAVIDDNLDLLAFHYQRSNNLKQAALYLIRAGRWAYSVMAFSQAAMHLEQGLIFLDSSEEGEEKISERIRVRGDLALALISLGADEGRIESLLEETLQMAERAGDFEQIAMTNIHFCTHRFRQGAQDLVVDHALKAIETAERAHAPEPHFRGHFALASAYRLNGRIGESIEEAKNAIGIYEAHFAGEDVGSSDLHSVYMQGIMELGSAYAKRGEITEANECIEQAKELVRKYKNLLLMGAAIKYFEFDILAALHRWPKALMAMEELAVGMKDLDFPFAEAGVNAGLGTVKIHLGQAEEGLALVKKGIEVRLRIGQKIAIGHFFLNKAEGLRRLGRAEEAIEACRTGIAYANETEEGLVPILEEAELRIRCEGAEGEELHSLVPEYEAVLSRIEEMGLRPNLARGRRSLAGFLRRLGEEKRALALEEKAVAFLRQMGAADAEEEEYIPAPGRVEAD